MSTATVLMFKRITVKITHISDSVTSSKVPFIMGAGQ